MDMRASIDLPHGITKAELIKAIEAIPDDAKVSVRSYAGDRPWESGTQTMSFNWER